MYFAFSNIKFKKHSAENWLVISGEITNNAGKNFQAVVFRLVIFNKNTPICNTTFTINGFHIGQTKTFERQVGELEYKIVPEISRYEIYAESAY